MSAMVCVCGLTFELSGRQRQDARPGLAKMYRVPPDRAWWHAVGAPLERIRRDFPPFINGVEAPRLSCVFQSELKEGKSHSRGYTSIDRTGRR